MNSHFDTGKKDSADYAFEIAGSAVPVRIKRNSRARRLILRVREASREIALTVPDHCDEQSALEFLQKNRRWVEERLDRLPAVTPFAHGTTIPLRGESHEILFAGSRSGSSIVEVSRTEAKDQLIISGKEEHAPRRLKDWLKKQARQDLKQCVDFHADRLQLTPTRINVRDQKSRWGSCSSTGALSFSWRLILAPRHVLDYVAAHEVAHLAEMNHGPRFWKLVELTMPDYENAQHWLKQHGAGLHMYGA